MQLETKFQTLFDHFLRDSFELVLVGGYREKCLTSVSRSPTSSCSCGETVERRNVEA